MFPPLRLDVTGTPPGLENRSKRLIFANIKTALILFSKVLTPKPPVPSEQTSTEASLTLSYDRLFISTIFVSSDDKHLCVLQFRTQRTVRLPVARSRETSQHTQPSRYTWASFERVIQASFIRAGSHYVTGCAHSELRLDAL